MVTLEVCANGLNSALAAQEGGAQRVELCDNLLEGGTTPSYGQIAMTRKLLQIEVYPIIRPRGGDFVYSDYEFEVMKTDVVNCKALQCDGVVFGILTPEGRVDKLRCRILAELASPMAMTFHMAFDVAEDLFQAMEDIIGLGFKRILSSGAATTAVLGADVLKALIAKAAGRIEIMPGAGVNSTNVKNLIESTGATAVHGSFSKDIPYRLTDINEVNQVQLILADM